MGSLFSFASRKVASSSSMIGWEIRYDGVLTVAIVNNIPFAGISGPWPDGNFALTWWSTRSVDASPKMEFHPTMEHARKRVEDVAGNVACAA